MGIVVEPILRSPVRINCQRQEIGLLVNFLIIELKRELAAGHEGCFVLAKTDSDVSDFRSLALAWHAGQHFLFE